MIEYVLATAVTLSAMLMPFGDGNLSALQRLLLALRADHAGYMYMAGLPSLPRDDGTGGPIPTGGIGSGDSGAGPGNPTTPGGNSGGLFDPGPGDDGPDDGDDSIGDGAGSGGEPGLGGIGAPGAPGGNGSGGSGAGNPNPGNDGGGTDPGGSQPGESGNGDGSDDGTGDGGNGAGDGSPDTEPGTDPNPNPGNDDQGSGSVIGGGGGGGSLTSEAYVAIGAATGYFACLASDEQTPDWTDDDLLAYEAAGQAYVSDTPQLFAALGIPYQPENEFSANLTQTADGRWILAFRGTRITSRDDWENNIDQAFGEASSYDQAVELALNVQDRLGSDVLHAGHSLGGGLASAAAHATNGRAITFNAAGLHSNYQTGTPQIRAHYVVGEILRSMQSATPLPQAVGTPIAHSASCTTDPFRRHFLGAFGESIERWRASQPNASQAPAGPNGLSPYQPPASTAPG